MICKNWLLLFHGKMGWVELKYCLFDAGTARLIQHHQFDPIRPARQTRTNLPVHAVVLDVPKVGFLTSSEGLGVEQVVRQKRNTTSHGPAPAGSSASATYKLLTCHVIILATTAALLFWSPSVMASLWKRSGVWLSRFFVWRWNFDIFILTTMFLNGVFLEVYKAKTCVLSTFLLL